MTDILTVTMNPCIDVSARTERVRPTSKLRCDQVQRHPGGGGINVARVLHRLGADCAALYPVGGSTGQLLVQLMEEEGVRSMQVPVAGHIRESFTVADTASHQEYRFVLPGPELSEAEWQACLSRVAALPSTPDIVVGSGSLPPGVPADFYARLGQHAKGGASALGNAKSARLIVDTSGPALAAALAAGVFMVKPSLREMRELTGQALTTMDELRAAGLQWIANGWAQLVVVSLGGDGALLITPQQAVYAPPLTVSVVSAVGAGDSFVAGMAMGLSKGVDWVEAFRLGVACGTAALSSTGTGLCARADAQALVKDVRCLSDLPTRAI